MAGLGEEAVVPSAARLSSALFSGGKSTRSTKTNEKETGARGGRRTHSFVDST